MLGTDLFCTNTCISEGLGLGFGDLGHTTKLCCHLLCGHLCLDSRLCSLFAGDVAGVLGLGVHSSVAGGSDL